MARRPLAVDDTSDIFLFTLGGIMRSVPGLRADPSVTWRVQDALAAVTFSEWGRFTKRNSQDTFHSASQCSQKAGARNGQYARVSPFLRSEAKLSLIAIQYDTSDTPFFQPGGQDDPPRSHYGRLQHIISVTFPKGYEDLQLYEGTTFAFALFHECILTPKDPRLDRLNIHFYSVEDTNLQITDISCVHGLVGRIKDGPKSWAIIDRTGRFSREAYLTHEAS